MPQGKRRQRIQTRVFPIMFKFLQHKYPILVCIFSTRLKLPSKASEAKKKNHLNSTSGHEYNFGAWGFGKMQVDWPGWKLIVRDVIPSLLKSHGSGYGIHKWPWMWSPPRGFSSPDTPKKPQSGGHLAERAVALPGTSLWLATNQ